MRRRMKFSSLVVTLHAQAFMHDRTGRRVLHVDFLVWLDLLLDGECRERSFMKAAQNEFFLAGLEIDIADRIDPGLGGFEFFCINVNRFAIDIETPLRDRAKFRRQPEKYQHMVSVYLCRHAIL